MNPEKVLDSFNYFLLSQVSCPNLDTVITAGQEHIREMEKYLNELEEERV